MWKAGPCGTLFATFASVAEVTLMSWQWLEVVIGGLNWQRLSYGSPAEVTDGERKEPRVINFQKPVPLFIDGERACLVKSITITEKSVQVKREIVPDCVINIPKETDEDVSNS